eukprot:333378-Pleurochrysis_carterae.AAC.1
MPQNNAFQRVISTLHWPAAHAWFGVSAFQQEYVARLLPIAEIGFSKATQCAPVPWPPSHSLGLLLPLDILFRLRWILVILQLLLHVLAFGLMRSAVLSSPFLLVCCPSSYSAPRYSSMCLLCPLPLLVLSTSSLLP